MTITEQATTGTLTSTLGAEVVDALWPQWAVNGHDLPAAFATVAEHHLDPVVRHTAATTPLLPALLTVLEGRFWKQYRADRAMLRS